MPDFIARIGTQDGTVMERSFTAESEKALLTDLQEREYLVFGIRRKSALGSLIPDLGRRRRISQKEFLLFNQELASLIRAGLPILSGLDILLERRKNPVFRQALSEVRDQVRAGSSLSEAFEAQGDLFPNLYSSTLASGERTGEVASVLQRYISYQKVMMATARKITSALVYPCILLMVSFGVIFILVTFVVPKFIDFYADFGSELPLITRLLMGFSSLTTDYFFHLLGALLVGIVGFQAWHRTETGRLFVDRTKLKIPLVGGILHRFAVTRFVRTLATLMSGGITVMTALGTATRAVGNMEFERRLKGVERKVREGGTLWQALEATGLFSDIAIEMTKVGEATGALDDMLANISEFYDEEIDARLGTIMSLIEPIMLIGMGLIVGTMLLAIYMPLLRSYAESTG